MNTTLKTILTRYRETVTQFVKFGLVGLLNTSIHYLVFLALYRYAGVHYLISTVVGYCIGIFNSFLLNKNWTFKTVNVRKDVEFLKFVVVNIVSMLVNVITLHLTVAVMHLIPEIGQIIAVFFHTCANFIGNKYWTFHQGQKKRLTP